MYFYNIHTKIHPKEWDKNNWNKLLQVFLLTSQIMVFPAHFGKHQFSLSIILCLEISLMIEIIGQSRRNKSVVEQLDKGSRPRKDSPSPSLNGEDESFWPEESQMCYLLCLSVSGDIRCDYDFCAFLSIPHSPCVAHFYHLLWVSCHSAALPLHSLSWAFDSRLKLLVPSEQLVALWRQRKWVVLRRTPQREGPEEASRGCLYLRKRWVFPFKATATFGNSGEGAEGRGAGEGEVSLSLGSRQEARSRAILEHAYARWIFPAGYCLWWWHFTTNQERSVQLGSTQDRSERALSAHQGPQHTAWLIPLWSLSWSGFLGPLPMFTPCPWPPTYIQSRSLQAYPLQVDNSVP